MKTKWYLIGDPAVRERISERTSAVKPYVSCALIISAAVVAAFFVGYLYGLTCFYWG